MKKSRLVHIHTSFLILVFAVLPASLFAQSTQQLYLDYTKTRVVYMGESPDKDTAYKNQYYKTTLKDSIEFITLKQEYAPGEKIQAILINNSHTSFLLCDTHITYLFDSTRNEYRTRQEIDFCKVQQEGGKVWGSMFRFGASYSVFMEPAFPGENDFEKHKDTYLLLPGEKIEMTVSLPFAVGNYQLKFYAVPPGKTNGGKGRGFYAHSKPFMLKK